MDVNTLAQVIRLQADQLFPHRTDSSMFLKMYGEVAELIDAGEDCGGEVADVLIMVLDYAHRKGINVETAILDKMAVNNGRVWKMTKIGTMQHE
jgi:NTP pyrophosphatase (non-canonical NTP hydrolase)